jgi:benzylmalate synthase
MNNKLLIIDETLRDGEQQAGINFSYEQKLDLASKIFDAGVDFITLMPVISDEEYLVSKQISEKGKVLCLTPCNESFIETSLSVSKYILLFQGVSDFLMKHRHKTEDVYLARKNNNKLILSCLEKSVSKNAEVHFGLEDASRANRQYLKEVLNLINPFVSLIYIADSVGVMKPEEIKDLVLFIKQNTNHPLVIHTHNDIGLADENAVAAVEAGCVGLSGTFTGIGERAGNMNIFNVVKKLKDIGFVSELDFSKINEIEESVIKFAQRVPAEPFSDEAFWHESGIHAHALLSKNPVAYNGVDPDSVGKKHVILFGKKSGISNFKFYLGDKYSDDQYRDFLKIIKDKSIKENKTFTFDETKSILNI